MIFSPIKWGSNINSYRESVSYKNNSVPYWYISVIVFTSKHKSQYNCIECIVSYFGLTKLIFDKLISKNNLPVKYYPFRTNHPICNCKNVEHVAAFNT